MVKAHHASLIGFALTAALVAGSATAQEIVPDRKQVDRIVKAGIQADDAGTSVAPPRASSKKWIVLGTAVGAGAGLFVGELYFGQTLDIPHGPDILLGAGIGAATGATIAWALTRGGSKSSSTGTTGKLVIAPVVSKSHKAVMVTFVPGR